MAAVCGASLALAVYLGVLLLPPAATGLQSEDRVCAFTDHLQGPDPQSGPTSELRGVVSENGTVRCSSGSRCYGLWEKRGDGETHLVKQGCWTHIGDQQECHGDSCLVTATPSQIQNGSYRFCCCGRDLCNVNFTEAPTTETPALRPMKPSGRVEQQTDHQPLRREVTVLIALVTVAIAAIVVMALFLGYRMMKGKQKLCSLSALDALEAATCEPAVDLDNLKLFELIGRGRYGSVYRGCLNERRVAVKLFSSANRHNYATERFIYGLPLLQQHDNVARFLAADERTAGDGRPEFLILLEFYAHGCLSRYLSVHTVDWSTCCRMTHGVTSGLAFLHTELYRGDQFKPAVAHRDVTSRNVLVRADLSCVLADFGLSMKLTGNCPGCHGDDDTMVISEVGTVRYMAPEVLGGALNLRDCEVALKQVDVYALGLLYWESFRRCCDLFPGAVAPEFQVAFQAELGNHPSVEEMQSLVVREKGRPRFPEAWKENSPALRSLKETMEDCWDQDAEARLTAQCAEERLSDLTLLSTPAAAHTHRNLSHGRWPSQSGCDSYIEDLQVGVVKNLQAEGHLASVAKTLTCGPDGAHKNRNSINYDRQQAQARLSGSDSSVSSACVGTLAPVLYTISESQHIGGPTSSVPVCLHLTEEDLESTKLDPKEVDKNLRESSDENLMEHSQKQFGSEPQSTSLMYHHLLQTTEVNHLVSTPPDELGVVVGGDTPSSASIHGLPKQQNLPLRPTSLHLLPKTKEITSTSSGLKLGKLKSNHRQVETGVAKMNTLRVATAAEPHLASNTTGFGSGSCSAGVPTLVTNGGMGGGRTNLAGPQLEEGKMDGGMFRGEETCSNLLNFSPDEHEPLLRREQSPAESETLPHPTGQGSNSNNNNNRVAVGSRVKIQGLEVQSRSITGSEVSVGKPEQHLGPGGSSAFTPLTNMENKIQLSGPVAQATDAGLCLQPAPITEPALDSRETQIPKGQPVHCEVRYEDQHPDSTKAQKPPAAQEQEPGPESFASVSESIVLDLLQLQASAIGMSNLAASSDPKAPRTSPLEVPHSESLTGKDLTTTASPQSAVLHISADGPSTGRTKVRRTERPCSLDLSSTCSSTDDLRLADSSVSASGEKIKRRVKTPYTLKKWRPASWVLSTDTALDPDLEFSSSSSSFSSGLQTVGGFGISRINQSKSSMAVFLVGGGPTATTASEPDGMTHF